MEQYKNFFNNSIKYNLIIFIISISSLGLALLSQEFYKLYPCTFCIVARYIISTVAILSLFSLITNFSLHKKDSTKFNIPRILKKISILLSGFIILNSLIGIYFNIQHYIVVFKNDFSCGIDELQEYLNSLFFAQIWPYMYEATGNCVDANFELLGFIDYVHLPLLLYITFIAMSIINIIFQFKKK